jgi:hypothetical protein
MSFSMSYCQWSWNVMVSTWNIVCETEIAHSCANSFADMSENTTFVFYHTFTT